MNFTTTRSVTDLPLPDRQALEHLLGSPLADQQQVFIMPFTPGQRPDEATRAAARRDLEQTLNATGQHAEQRQVTAAEADAAVDEAMADVRKRGQ